MWLDLIAISSNSKECFWGCLSPTCHGVTNQCPPTEIALLEGGFSTGFWVWGHRYSSPSGSEDSTPLRHSSPVLPMCCFATLEQAVPLPILLRRCVCTPWLTHSRCAWFLLTSSPGSRSKASHWRSSHPTHPPAYCSHTSISLQPVKVW